MKILYKLFTYIVHVNVSHLKCNRRFMNPILIYIITVVDNVTFGNQLIWTTFSLSIYRFIYFISLFLLISADFNYEHLMFN